MPACCASTGFGAGAAGAGSGGREQPPAINTIANPKNLQNLQNL